MLDWLVSLFGLATKKEFLMLKEDLNNKLDVLAGAVVALEARVDQAVADANANSVTQSEVDKVQALVYKVNSVLAPVAEPSEPVVE